jgi:hypothetical protein
VATPKENWDIAKEALGFIGAVLMVLPWLRDFLLRLKRDWYDTLPVGGTFIGAAQHFRSLVSRQIDSPKHADLILTILGIICLAISFLIGFLRAVSG